MQLRCIQRSALLAALVCGVPALAAAQRSEGTFERTLTVSGQAQVEISTGSGSIEVRTGSANRVEVVGRVSAGDDWGWRRSSRLSADERVKRIQAAPPIEQSGSVVRIGEIKDEELRDGVSISFTVTLPADSTLRARSGSGSQRIDGVQAGVNASTGSGSVVLRSIAGTVSVSTGSGSITADGLKGSLQASTGSGSIRASGVAGAMTAKTSSGGIELEQVGSGDVDVSSSSGTIRLRGVNGALHASTTSGSLIVGGEMRGDWRLGSSSGSVRVDVPDSAGFELDASSSSGSIDLGMPVNVVGRIDRHSLRGTVKTGGPRLYVRTSSGGIHID